MEGSTSKGGGIEEFIVKSFGVGLGIFVLAYTIYLGLRLHDAYVTSQSANAQGGAR